MSTTTFTPKVFRLHEDKKDWKLNKSPRKKKELIKSSQSVDRYPGAICDYRRFLVHIQSNFLCRDGTEYISRVAMTGWNMRL